MLGQDCGAVQGGQRKKLALRLRIEKTIYHRDTAEQRKHKKETFRLTSEGYDLAVVL